MLATNAPNAVSALHKLDECKLWVHMSLTEALLWYVLNSCAPAALTVLCKRSLCLSISIAQQHLCPPIHPLTCLPSVPAAAAAAVLLPSSQSTSKQSLVSSGGCLLTSALEPYLHMRHVQLVELSQYMYHCQLTSSPTDIKPDLLRCQQHRASLVAVCIATTTISSNSNSRSNSSSNSNKNSSCHTAPPCKTGLNLIATSTHRTHTCALAECAKMIDVPACTHN